LEEALEPLLTLWVMELSLSSSDWEELARMSSAAIFLSRSFLSLVCFFDRYDRGDSYANHDAGQALQTSQELLIVHTLWLLPSLLHFGQ
jgi:hypothetical protein